MRESVTIVVATYDWPAALLQSLQSVLLQSHAQWQVLVVGDACGPETGRELEQLNDPRIRYVNLSARCGEQSIPNSVGMALAQSDYIAFLNHDDVWLPDHLETGIRALEATQADLFIGQAAFAVKEGRDLDLVLFENISPRNRTLGATFSSAYYLFEPMSAWIVTREAATRVGPFKPAGDLFRTPLEDWLLRAWRKGLNQIEGSEVTVLKNT